ncbi:MAG: alpha/beta fold hydrolase [Acidimicrobiales bacterium]
MNSARGREPTGYFETPDGVRLAFDVTGDGPAVLMLHGFASDAWTNWWRPGVVEALLGQHRRVVTYDARGHGRSDKPHEASSYGDDVMMRDASELADYLEMDRFDVVGYSMGAQTTAFLVPTEQRVRRCVLGGIGSVLLVARPDGRRYPTGAIADGLEADDRTTIEQATAKAFRAFADATKADRLALAALQRSRDPDRFPDLASIGVPTLVLVGERDTLIGDPKPVVAAIEGAQLAIVPGDHLSAVVQPEFSAELLRFLDG